MQDTYIKTFSSLQLPTLAEACGKTFHEIGAMFHNPAKGQRYQPLEHTVATRKGLSHREKAYLAMLQVGINVDYLINSYVYGSAKHVTANLTGRLSSCNAVLYPDWIGKDGAAGVNLGKGTVSIKFEGELAHKRQLLKRLKKSLIKLIGQLAANLDYILTDEDMERFVEDYASLYPKNTEGSLSHMLVSKGAAVVNQNRTVNLVYQKNAELTDMANMVSTYKGHLKDEPVFQGKTSIIWLQELFTLLSPICQLFSQVPMPQGDKFILQVFGVAKPAIWFQLLCFAMCATDVDLKDASVSIFGVRFQGDGPDIHSALDQFNELSRRFSPLKRFNGEAAAASTEHAAKRQRQDDDAE